MVLQERESVITTETPLVAGPVARDLTKIGCFADLVSEKVTALSKVRSTRTVSWLTTSLT